MTARHLTLEEISDRMQIDDVLNRYARAIDSKNFDLLADVFTSDAHIDYSASGGLTGAYPEIRKWLERSLSLFSVYQHALCNTTYQIDGDTARTRTYFVNPMLYKNADGGDHIFTIYGYYVDELVHTQAGWRIATRVEEQAVFDGSLPP